MLQSLSPLVFQASPRQEILIGAVEPAFLGVSLISEILNNPIQYHTVIQMTNKISEKHGNHPLETFKYNISL